MSQIMTGEATPAQIGGFLIGLRMKGETIEEIAAAAAVMRSLSAQVKVDVPYLVDTCGTGGDQSKIFNVSTGSAFVCAAAGAQVAKHGNRSVSSSSGSADLLERPGARLDLSPEQVGACIREVGLGFMFAPAHHNAMKHAIGPRKEMAVRTIFNVLGPLTNPAARRISSWGYSPASWWSPWPMPWTRLGSRHVLVVHSDDGLDEISIAAPTQVAELRTGWWIPGCSNPGIRRASRQPAQPVRGQPSESLSMINRVLDGEPGPRATCSCSMPGRRSTLRAWSIPWKPELRAREAIDSGAARHKLKQFVELTQSL
jgi:anthranilate phosphoribosyltransferase